LAISREKSVGNSEEFRHSSPAKSPKHPLHPSEARTKELIADRAEDVVVLADSSKADREVAAWAPLPSGWSWIDENGERTQGRKGA
jgi:hypothetical protein